MTEVVNMACAHNEYGISLLDLREQLKERLPSIFDKLFTRRELFATGSRCAVREKALYVVWPSPRGFIFGGFAAENPSMNGCCRSGSRNVRSPPIVNCTP